MCFCIIYSARRETKYHSSHLILFIYKTYRSKSRRSLIVLSFISLSHFLAAGSKLIKGTLAAANSSNLFQYLFKLTLALLTTRLVNFGFSDCNKNTKLGFSSDPPFKSLVLTSRKILRHGDLGAATGSQQLSFLKHIVQSNYLKRSQSRNEEPCISVEGFIRTVPATCSCGAAGVRTYARTVCVAVARAQHAFGARKTECVSVFRMARSLSSVTVGFVVYKSKRTKDV